jgi:adenylate kinase family enzyme
VTLQDHPRIVVVGTSGAGKTTFARALATSLAYPHVELDVCHWGPNWTVRPDFVERVDRAIQADTWVLDGNYSAVRDLVWARASAIVWLNFSFPVVFGRALLRSLRRIVTRELVFGSRETWSRLFAADGIPRWVLQTYRRRRQEYPALFASPEFRHLEIFELRSPEQAAALLESVGERRGVPR